MTAMTRTLLEHEATHPQFVDAGKTEFRDAMARLGAAVSIITSDGPAGRAGCTASAVCSVSDEPPILLVCLNRTSRNNAPIRDNGRLCVNILGAEQASLARIFADGTLSSDERFASAEWLQEPGGSPALSQAAASVDCDILKIEEVGSHSVFFCQVKRVRLTDDRSGLIYLDRAFHQLPQSAA